MIFDIIVLVVVLISAIIAMLRGFIREVLTIIGVTGGSLAAVFLGPLFVPLMDGWLGVPARGTGGDHHKDIPKIFGLIPADIMASVLAYGGVFITVVLVLSIISYFLASGAKAIGLGPVDRALGFVFGIARAFVLLSILYIPLTIIQPHGKERDEWSIFKGSKTHFFIAQGATWIVSLVPGETQKKLEETAGQTAGTLKEDALRRALGTGQQDNEKGVSPSVPPATDKAAPDQTPQGYAPDQRQGLDSLIKKNQ